MNSGWYGERPGTLTASISVSVPEAAAAVMFYFSSALVMSRSLSSKDRMHSRGMEIRPFFSSLELSNLEGSFGFSDTLLY